MITPDLLTHIREQVSRGTSRTLIIQELLRQGWPIGDINEGLNAVGGTQMAPVGQVTHTGGTAAFVITTAVMVLIIGVGYWGVTHLSSFYSLPFLKDQTFIIATSTAGNAFALVPDEEGSSYTLNGVTYKGSSNRSYTTFTSQSSSNVPGETSASIASTYIPPLIPDLQTSISTDPTPPLTQTCPTGDTGIYPNCVSPPPNGQPPPPGHLTVRGSQIIAPGGQPIVLRGFNWGPISDNAQPQDGTDNAAQGANFVRIPLSWYSSNRLDTTDCSGGALDYDPNAPGTIPPANLAIIDKEVMWASSAHLWIDLVVRGGDCDFWTNPNVQTQYVTMWKFLAARYKDTPYMGSYELLSEPNPPKLATGAPDNATIKAIYEKIIAGVRSVDTVTPVVIGQYDIRFLDQIYLSDQTNVIYTFNFYEPAQYVKSANDTRAVAVKAKHPTSSTGYPGTYFDQANTSSTCNYPGKGQEVLVDKTWLAGLLSCATAFRNTHNVPIFVNQIGLTTNVPGAQQYVADILSLFNANTISFTYWEYRSGTNKGSGSAGVLYLDTNGVWQTKQDWLTLVTGYFRG
ncbi:cellulase family glycosylhydrolase, partial [Patescibacteria group bacterium]|nr:cellulase family glycosylhydrolase [Patescibacteria group bacterium]